MGSPTTGVFELPGEVGDVVEALATHRDQRGVVLGGGRGESGDTAPGRDWDLLVYVEPGHLGRLDFTGRLNGFDVSPTPNMPFVCAEGAVRLDDGDAVEVLFVDTALVRASAEASRRGSFTLCPMARLISGMPSYVVEAEIVRGVLCAPEAPAVPTEPPQALIEAATSWWHGRASLSLLLAGDCTAKDDPLAASAHLLAAAQSFAHVVGLRSGWYLPAKSFVTRTLRSWPGGERALALLAARPSSQGIRELGDLMGLTEASGLAWAEVGRERGIP